MPEIVWTDILLSLVPSRVVDRWSVAVSRIPPIHGGVAFVRRDGQFVLWHSPVGDIWARFTDGRTLALLIAEQLETHAYDLDPVCVRPGDVVLDVGANLGVFTRFALNRDARKVIAFEPNGQVAECFTRTFAGEIRSGRVHLVPAAAWRVTERLHFDTTDNHLGGRISGHGIEISARAIDDVVGEIGVDRVDFIKMDVEGAERHALAGAARTLRNYRPRMAICSYHLNDDVQVLPEVVLAIVPEYKLVRRRDYDYYCCE